MARPKDPSRNDAALRATRDLLATVGYDGFSMDDVAHRIGSSKTTLYRRWPSKVHLAIAAIGTPDAEIVIGASLRDDLRALATAHMQSDDGQSVPIIAGVLWAARTDPELAAAVRDGVAQRRLDQFQQVVIAAQKRGEIGEVPANWQYVGELMPALIMYHFATGQATDSVDLEMIVDTIIAPLLLRAAVQR